MKRICFGVLAALMMLSLVGCGDMTGLPETLPTLEPFNFEDATPSPVPAADTPAPVATAAPTATPEPVPTETPAPVNDNASAEPASEEAASGEAASGETASEEATEEPAPEDETELNEDADAEEDVEEADAEVEEEDAEEEADADEESDTDDTNPAAEAVEQELAEPMEEEDVEEEDYPVVPGTYESEAEEEDEDGDRSVLTVEEDGSCTYETLVSGTVEENSVSLRLTFKGTLENGKITFDSVWYNDIDLTQLALDAGFEDASRWEMAAELLYIGE